MRSILLYLLGVPIPFILLIALFTHHCWSVDVNMEVPLRVYLHDHHAGSMFAIDYRPFLAIALDG